MDENSCKGETSESAENSVDVERAKKEEEVSDKCFPEENIVIDFPSGASGNTVSDRCGSSFDASGPSPDLPPPVYTENEEVIREGTNEGNKTPVICSRVSSFEVQVEDQLHVRMAPDVEERSTSEATSIGPPPSYSFVMKQKKKLPKTPSTDPLVLNRPPPPTYCGVRGLYVTPEEGRLDRVCDIRSFSEPIWRSHSQPALCPRCGILILTTTHSHDSIATHVAALALCLFGCWPCCLLPYFLNACKNTYHYCPICQAFIGAYTPW